MIRLLTNTVLLLVIGAAALADDSQQLCVTTNYTGPTLRFPVASDATIKCYFTNQPPSPDFDAGVLYVIDSRQPHFNMSLTAPIGLHTTNEFDHYITDSKNAFELASKPFEAGTNIIQMPHLSGFTTNSIVIGSFSGVVLSSTAHIPPSGRLMYHKLYLLLGEEGGIRASVSTLYNNSFDCAESLLAGITWITKSTE